MSEHTSNGYPYGGIHQPEIERSTQLCKRLLTDRPVAYHPFLAKAVGGATAGIFLSQLLYWSDKGADPDGWIYKTQAEWTDETALTRIEQETARKHLRSLGILEEHHARLEHRLNYRICWDKLLSLMQQSPMWKTDAPESGKPTFGKVENPHSYNEQRVLTENTTESTNIYIPPWLKTLREVNGWTERGKPHEEPLIEWVQARAITDDQLERSAIGLGAVQTKTLRGYENLAKAFQVRINKGYDVAPQRGTDGKSRADTPEDESNPWIAEKARLDKLREEQWADRGGPPTMPKVPG